MTKQWRLLNEGERIELGDEWLMCSGEWKSVTNSVTGTPIQAQLLPHRRLISNQGWIKLSERVPTEADTDDRGEVRVRYYNSCVDKILNSTRKLSDLPSNVIHWHPLPKFQEQDEDEEAFRKGLEIAGIADRITHVSKGVQEGARKLWDAALEYARKKQ